MRIPLEGGVVRPTPGSCAIPADVLDGKLLAEQSDLGLGLFEAGLEATVARSSASRVRDDDAGQADGVKHRRLDVFRPLAGETDRRVAWHAGLRRRGSPSS